MRFQFALSHERLKWDLGFELAVIICMIFNIDLLKLDIT